MPDHQAVGRQLRVVSLAPTVLHQEVLTICVERWISVHQQRGIRCSIRWPERHLVRTLAENPGSNPSEQELAEAVVIAPVVVHHVEAAEAARRSLPGSPRRLVVVVVVGQPEGMAGLVNDDSGRVGRRSLALKGVPAEPLAVHHERIVRPRLVVGPPEAGPLVGRPGVDHDEVVDAAVAVVVVPAEVVALAVKMGDRLEDQRLAAAGRLLHGAARIGGSVPAEGRAPDVEQTVGGTQVELAQALVGIA